MHAGKKHVNYNRMGSQTDCVLSQREHYTGTAQQNALLSAKQVC